MQTIVITGASSGIGKETAKLFAEHGWRVIATMRTPENENELTKYDNVELYPLDVTLPEQVKQTAEAILSRYDVDVLFHNAGYGMRARFEDMTDEMIHRSIDTNILGMVRVLQAFIPHFKQRRGGTILVTTSLAGVIGLPLDGVYAADKWAAQGMCEMLHFELRPFGVRVKALVPGAVKSKFKMATAPIEGYDRMIENQANMLMPDKTQIETAAEAAHDAYAAATDPDDDRVDYVTGEVANQLYKKREELGNEGFRAYLREILLAK